MTSPPSPADISSRLSKARALFNSHDLGRAERAYQDVLNRSPGHAEASSQLARLALRRGNLPQAIELLHAAFALHPHDAALAIDLAVTLLNSGHDARAIAVLESAVSHSPEASTAWLLLGRVRKERGDSPGALEAWYQAVTRAQRQGQWHDSTSTPPQLLDAVLEAIERVRTGRRQLFYASYEETRRQFGAASMKRVDRALANYLGNQRSQPIDPRQRPKFFYFPDLPSEPYLNPSLQAWASTLSSGFASIREEALRLIDDERRLPDFLDIRPGDAMANYLGGDAAEPTWEAFFFYRHGTRYDANHARCPATSAILESIELCRIADQAPEICFSVLRAGTHIKPHYGVTNTRVVVHLPLIVPDDCALHVIGAGERQWREGELLMFDDTFQHEAWNRSNETRIVLLMDCWNPYLTAEEKLAIRQIVEKIGGLRLASLAGEPQS